VKHFFKYLSAFGLYNNIAIGFKSFKVDDGRSKDTFTREEIRSILSSIDTTTQKGKRDFAMLILAINGGLRIIEIQRANIEDIEELHGTKFLFIQGKGKTSKKEKFALEPITQQALEEYLATRPNAKKEEPLFTGTSNNQKGTRMTEPSISRLFKTILKASGFDSKRLTSHSFRHTANSILFEETGNLFQTQRFARHKDPKTTEIYIHTQEKEKDHSEAIIFNSIFNENKSEVNKEEMKNTIDRLSDDQLKKLSIYLQTL
jgi:integrase